MPTKEHAAEAAQEEIFRHLDFCKSLMDRTMTLDLSELEGMEQHAAHLTAVAEHYAVSVRLRRKYRLPDRLGVEGRLVNMLRRDNVFKKDFLEGKLRRAPRES